ncbi:RNA-dependent RNA polymerase SHL [Salix suchowensis]|nr:RNA-dependent RNA polymerase SHL [Salix suchowensis]
MLEYVGDDVWNNIDLSPDVSQTSDHVSHHCNIWVSQRLTICRIKRRQNAATTTLTSNAELAKAEMMPSGPENSDSIFFINNLLMSRHPISESSSACSGVGYHMVPNMKYGGWYPTNTFHLNTFLWRCWTSWQPSVQVLKQLLCCYCPWAYQVEDSKSYLAAYAKEVNAKSPWAEFDWEEEAMQKDQYACLGLSDDGCYGGKIILGGKLDDSTSSIKLDRAELGSSSRFLRRFGSRQFLRIKIPRKCTIKEVFRAFYAKEDNVFLFSCNEIWNGLHIKPAQSQDFSLMDFILWHNPLEVNKSQTMTKWAARLHLAFQILPLDVGYNPRTFSAPTGSSEGSDMTDGAGFINLAGLHQLYHKFGWSRMPTAIQCRAGAGSFDDRLGDAKLLEPRIQLRPSQVKIKHAASSCHDPSWQVIDVLRASHFHSPSRLSTETIINLAENGVPAQAFINLLRASLKATIDPLLQWDGPDAMLDLWSAVAQVGGSWLHGWPGRREVRLGYRVL